MFISVFSKCISAFSIFNIVKYCLHTTTALPDVKEGQLGVASHHLSTVGDPLPPGPGGGHRLPLVQVLGVQLQEARQAGECGQLGGLGHQAHTHLQQPIRDLLCHNARHMVQSEVSIVASWPITAHLATILILWTNQR